MKRITAATTIEDLMANPAAYGVPTFKQFQKAKEKFFGREDDQMISLTEGPQNFRRDLQKIIYKVHGVQLASEEEVEKALKDHGYSLADINLEKRDTRLKKDIQVHPKGGGKYDIIVNFLP